MDHILGAAMEDARQHFMDNYGAFYKFANSKEDRQSLDIWLKTASEDPLEHSVKVAAARNRIDDSFILNKMKQSLKFRVLSGILSRPVEYDDSGRKNGLCGCQEYDEETGGWPCKVPNNQAQADAWHSKFGNDALCPFYKNPNPQDPVPKDELEKMLRDEEKSLEEAFHSLGLENKKH